jgi:hypothetical protein
VKGWNADVSPVKCIAMESEIRSNNVSIGIKVKRLQTPESIRTDSLKHTLKEVHRATVIF